jgi:hypothetical protein
MISLTHSFVLQRTDFLRAISAMVSRYVNGFQRVKMAFDLCPDFNHTEHGGGGEREEGDQPDFESEKSSLIANTKNNIYHNDDLAYFPNLQKAY